MEKIVSKVSVKTVDQFSFGTLTGTNWAKVRALPQSVFRKLYREAHEGSYDDIKTFWAMFGAVEAEFVMSANRVVDNGLESITNTMVANANSTAMPSKIAKIALGRDPIPSFVQGQSALVNQIVDASGLATTTVGVVISNIASGNAGSKKDTIQVAKTFTVADATLVNDAGEGVEAAAILNADDSMYACTGVSPERLLSTNGDTLVVTYKSRLIG